MSAATQLPDSFGKYSQDGTMDLDTDVIHGAIFSWDTEFVATTTSWVASTAKSVGDLLVPTVDNGHVYRCIVAGTTAGSEPTWPKDGSTVVDNDITWLDIGANIDPTQTIWVEDLNPWQASHAYLVDDLCRPITMNGHWYKCTTGGTSGGSEPSWNTGSGSTTTDGTVVWTEQGVNFAANEITGSGYAQGGKALTNKAMTYSGYISKFDADDLVWASSTITGRCLALWKNGTGNGIVNPLILFVLLDDTPADVSSNNSDFSVLWNAAGILNWYLKPNIVP
ncbi:MAG: hypothetical protein U9R60_17875 [Bacteroidota bacterium]|nr:hypothetical protein [Bacteroidota bacterium]